MSPDIHVPTKYTNLQINIFIADSCKYRLTSKVLIGWVAVSAVVAAIDFAGFVAFCVDYSRLKVTQPEYRDDTLTGLQHARNQRIGFDY